MTFRRRDLDAVTLAGDLAGEISPGSGLETAWPTPALHGPVHLEQLANGLTVCVVENPRAPLVSTALWYRAGSRDERPAELGIAHFLEHMMFKGAHAYGPGEIDRLTQALGGANNAFTSHDATAYHFDFAADRYQLALLLEADRMAGLRLDPAEVTSERQVIVEEIAMYEDDPWDRLELEVHAAFFADHPYGRPVLGTAATLAAIGPEELAAWHRQFYGPDNATLVVVGAVGREVFAEVDRHFGHLPARGVTPLRPRRELVEAPAGTPLRRLERRHGEVSRCLVNLPAPAAPSAEHAALRFLLSALALGRASRLQRALVDVGELCAWVSADLTESPDRSAVSFAFELLPGVEPKAAEVVLWSELARLATAPLTVEEVDRVRRVLFADWVFGHESIHQQAIVVGSGLCQFARGHAERQLAAALATPTSALPAVAARFLRADSGGLVGWSLPE